MKCFATAGLVLGVALMVACGTGCEKKQTGAGGKRIVMVVKASESEFWQIVIDGARQSAKDFGVEVVPQAPVSEADVMKQISIFENAISSRPDALILAPTSADPLVPAMETAMEEKIPLIVIDSAANTDQYTSFLASDNVKIGELSAECMAKALKTRKGKAAGKIAAISFLSGAGSLEKRKSGFLKVIKEKYPQIEVVAFRDAQGKSGATMNIVQDLLTKYRDLDGIYASNQPTGDETANVLDQESRKDLAVVVVDAGKMEQKGLEEGYIDYMIVQKPWVMGHMSVQFALKAINGEKIDKFVDTGIVAITQEMMKSGEAEEFLNPVEFHKKAMK